MSSINSFLESVHYLNHPLLSGLSALLVLLIGLFVLFQNMKSELYKTFFWMTLPMGVWFFSNALSMFYYNNFELAFFWYKAGYTLVPFICVAYYHFYLAYFKKKNKFLYLLYFIGILEVIYVWFSNNAGTGAYALANVGIVYQGMPPLSYFLAFGMVKYFIISTLTAVSFLNKYKKETNLFKKAQLKWLTILFFVIILGITEWIVAFNIPLHIAWMLMPFFVGIIAYNILKYQLMDIRLVIKKAFIYSTGIALASGVIVGISFLSSWFAERIPGFRFWTVPLIAGTAAFIIGRIFWKKSKEVDKMKYEFITVAAHKLRTSLTKVKWGLDALGIEIESGQMEKESGKQLVARVSKANEQTIELTNQLLNVVKTEAQEYPFTFPKTSLTDIMAKWASFPKAKAKAASFGLG